MGKWWTQGRLVGRYTLRLIQLYGNNTICHTITLIRCAKRQRAPQCMRYTYTDSFKLMAQPGSLRVEDQVNPLYPSKDS